SRPRRSRRATWRGCSRSAWCRSSSARRSSWRAGSWRRGAAAYLPETVRSIRVVTLNLWNDTGEAERRMNVLLPALVALDPQIVGLQEVRDVARGEHQAAQIARALGAEWRFAAAD